MYYFISKVVKAPGKISTKDDYQKLLENILSQTKMHPPKSANTSKTFKDELSQISKGKPLTEKTLWGGVALKKVDVSKNFIQKLLVIKNHGILGFEIHKYKLEKLKILEGTCLFLYSNHESRNWRKGKVRIDKASVGDKFEFKPGDEHGIITLSDCIIEETSTNHLDDLIYIFKADQV